MSERVCTVCGLPGHQVGLLLIASDAGRVVVGAFRGLGLSADLRQVVDAAHAGHEINAGDLVCMRHTAVRPDGRYVRLEDGG